VIISTDKTQLTQFSGGKVAYPVYLTLGNIPRAMHRKPSQNACVLIAYHSVSKDVGKNLTQKQRSACIQQLFHDSMCLVLEPLIQAGKEGIEITGGDGKVRQVFPILACYVADYPEQCLVTSSKYGTCPKCLSRKLGKRGPGPPHTQQATMATISNARDSATSETHFQQLCKEELVSGGVQRPFWEGFPLCDIHLSITPDVLHQLYQGVIKHMIDWCSSLMDDAELDSRLSTLPPCFGLHHFKGGWSCLSQISGKERKDMACILLGCLVGKVPSEAIVCYRALLDFIYISQYPTHDDDSLQYLEDALNLFHEHKHVLINLGVREHLDIPKFHSMLHYVESIKNFGTTDNYNTEMFERFHIDMAKDGWRASNFKNEVPQMTCWLSRQEKVSLFQSYIQDFISEGDSPSTLSLSRVDLAISQRPTVHAQTISSIQNSHHAPSFSFHLRQYLNTLLSQGDSIPHAQLANAQLPFDKLDVWHTCKLSLDVLGNDVDGAEGVDVVKAKPGRVGEARFDTVLVAHRDDAETTGLKGMWLTTSLVLSVLINPYTGMKLGHLHVIFKLPETVSPFLQAAPSWPKDPLAYVEWYQLSHHPGHHHGMYTATSPQPPQSGNNSESRHSRLFQITPGAVIPLKTIRQTCQLIPLARPGESWPPGWTSSTVLDCCNTFLLNNWSSKYAYQTIW
jgi:hypothetical protein